MKYQLPQFIETEVKLVGPFTLRQFLWIAAGGGLLFLFISILPFIWFAILAVPIGAGSLAMAFIKVDGMPLINYIAIMLSYGLNPKKYFFQNEEVKTSLSRDTVNIIK